MRNIWLVITLNKNYLDPHAKNTCNLIIYFLKSFKSWLNSDFDAKKKQL